MEDFFRKVKNKKMPEILAPVRGDMIIAQGNALGQGYPIHNTKPCRGEILNHFTM